jgi:hypothetical protein
MMVDTHYRALQTLSNGVSYLSPNQVALTPNELKFAFFEGCPDAWHQNLCGSQILSNDVVADITIQQLLQLMHSYECDAQHLMPRNNAQQPQCNRGSDRSNHRSDSPPQYKGRGKPRDYCGSDNNDS